MSPTLAGGPFTTPGTFFFFLNKNFEKLIIRKSTNQKNDKESLLEAHRRGSPSGYKQRKSSSMTVILRKCKCYTSLSHAGKEDIILTPVETVRKTSGKLLLSRGLSEGEGSGSPLSTAETARARVRGCWMEDYQREMSRIGGFLLHWPNGIIQGGE